MYKILKLREHPELKQTAAEWFHSKWGVPLDEYLKSMEECIAKSTAVPQWYVAVENGEIVGGLGVIENDFHERKDLTPNICAVYVEERCRCRGIAGKLLKTVCKDMSRLGVDTLYLLTDHDSFYERYDWKFLCEVTGDGEEKPSRMYVHKIYEPNRFDITFMYFVFINSVMTFLNQNKSANVVYMYVACYVLLLAVVVWCVALFVKNIRECGGKWHRILELILVTAGVAFWFGNVPTYTKDIIGGTISVTTEYYVPYSDTISIYTGDGNHYYVYCTEKLSRPLLDKFSFDKSKTLELEDGRLKYAGTPKVTITYYPNSKLVKEIVLHEE